jgi:hypothetical protein
MAMAIAQFASNCMACTTTIPSASRSAAWPSNKGNIYFTGDESIEILPTKDYMYNSMENASAMIGRPITKMDIFPARRQPGPTSRISLKTNRNQKNRKHRVIHQPGRSNCTQRYQGK